MPLLSLLKTPLSNTYVIILLSLSLSACSTFNKAPETSAPIVVEPVEKKVQYSVSPIIRPSVNDVRFAQSALKKVGYRIGLVDGIWGKRSSAALISFETRNGIESADGFLSELNLHTLESKSGLSLEQFNKAAVKVAAKNIEQLLNKKIPLKKSPQLIIVERHYQVLSKPNPYSSKLLKLTPGTGVYITAKQDGWYKIESLERQKGYVKVD